MSLTEIKRFKGAKNKHPTTLCKCDCGRERLVRTSRFKLGQVTMCAACARADGAKRGAETRRKLSDTERVVNDRYSVYKQNAKKNEALLLISPCQFFLRCWTRLALTAEPMSASALTGLIAHWVTPLRTAYRAAQTATMQSEI